MNEYESGIFAFEKVVSGVLGKTNASLEEAGVEFRIERSDQMDARLAADREAVREAVGGAIFTARLNAQRTEDLRRRLLEEIGRVDHIAGLVTEQSARMSRLWTEFAAIPVAFLEMVGEKEEEKGVDGPE